MEQEANFLNIIWNEKEIDRKIEKDLEIIKYHIDIKRAAIQRIVGPYATGKYTRLEIDFDPSERSICYVVGYFFEKREEVRILRYLYKPYSVHETEEQANMIISTIKPKSLIKNKQDKFKDIIVYPVIITKD